MMPGPWDIRPALAGLAAGFVVVVGFFGGLLWLLGCALSHWGVL